VTLLDHPAQVTAGGSTPRSILRRNRAALLLGGVLVAALAVLAVITGGGRSGELDPAAYDPTGAHALAVLLQDRAVQVQRTTDVPSTFAAAGSDATVFVPLPQLLSDQELAALGTVPGPLVVGGAGPRSLAALHGRVRVAGEASVSTRSPRCELPAATRAGRAEVGGFGYEPDTAGALGCYPAAGGASLLSLDNSRRVVVGSTSLFTNARLDRQGNAALALGLLGQRSRVVWLVPSPGRAVVGTRPTTDPDSLLPDGVRNARAALLVAVVALALWRARRLGRVVHEPLPVVVRAAETTEGRGRLYQAAGSRATAAEALRAGARDRVGARVGAGRHPQAEALSSLAATRTGRSTVDVHALLYGPPPADDAALVRLADDLDVLTREVADS
jgi:hypothetical protein